MHQRSQVLFEPRKSPVQARSAASVDAILQATIQVLLNVGKQRPTTAKVALQAGVSVGTLYQYFPNKSALLEAALKRHLAEVTEAVEVVCKGQEGNTLRQMATAVITTFPQAKVRKAKTSVALYSVRSDVDGAKIVQQVGTRFNKALVRMLATSREPLTTDPQLAAYMLQDAINSAPLFAREAKGKRKLGDISTVVRNFACFNLWHHCHSDPFGHDLFFVFVVVGPHLDSVFPWTQII
ncbi:MAG TPA: TetR/AcrR family transcriptional regulator [Candidatus Acidoferrum sp.]|nr:TetR/AcrR family transcriptional regulator [Candidatus Acidoferrum sp.]